jgi:hypothetical protein
VASGPQVSLSLASGGAISAGHTIQSILVQSTAVQYMQLMYDLGRDSWIEPRLHEPRTAVGPPLELRGVELFPHNLTPSSGCGALEAKRAHPLGQD